MSFYFLEKHESISLPKVIVTLFCSSTDVWSHGVRLRLSSCFLCFVWLSSSLGSGYPMQDTVNVSKSYVQFLRCNFQVTSDWRRSHTRAYSFHKLQTRLFAKEQRDNARLLYSNSSELMSIKQRQTGKKLFPISPVHSSCGVRKKSC